MLVLSSRRYDFGCKKLTAKNLRKALHNVRELPFRELSDFHVCNLGPYKMRYTACDDLSLASDITPNCVCVPVVRREDKKDGIVLLFTNNEEWILWMYRPLIELKSGCEIIALSANTLFRANDEIVDTFLQSESLSSSDVAIEEFQQA